MNSLIIIKLLFLHLNSFGILLKTSIFLTNFEEIFDIFKRKNKSPSQKNEAYSIQRA